ncbi:tubulointerstitial nephritis antigen-like [Macrosteles quadrilineatus]|uniref:tubulointerstitial nephritis antigen-like n=1 Tax=Macrosteles quadrilineatus TaxID=74068 RepID=UPI0023E2BDD7|nr:tubulointerstitial nephritis antigen-like [Macrosteles quadrilineatus]
MDLKAVVLVAVLAATKVFALSDMSDIPGRFCETRRTQCCAAREDDCSVPVMGTLCYCDQFCDRPNGDDCCPDYAYVCLNATRPTVAPITKGCSYKGRNYNEGTGVKINCNECKCQKVCTAPRNCRLEMSCTQNRCLVDPAAITAVNQDRFAGWKASNYSQFWGRTLDEGLSRRLGTRHSTRRAYEMRPIHSMFDHEKVRARLWYDLRQEKPGMISPPLDQGWCAADWVISTVQVATDRLALVSKGEDRTFLSPQHLLSCNAKNQRGCDGGHLTRAWKFIQKFGLVPEECYPWVGRQTNCSVPKVQDKKRTTARCSDGNSMRPLHRTGPAYRVSREPEAIMNEIMTSGPVQATMRVNPDFFSYRSGVYQCPSDMKSRRPENYHAVRVIGWGEEVQGGRLVKYWIVSNSWGPWWGENGFFRIVRGKNECEIESLVLGSWINPIVPRKDPSMPMMDKTNMFSNSL